MSWRTTDPLNCFRLQDKFSQNSFSKVSSIYPSIGSGGTCYIAGSVRVITKRSHTKTPFYQRRFLQPPVSCTQEGRFYASGDRPRFIVNEHFQMENFSCVKTLLLPGDFMTNIDLKDAYLSVPVHKSSRKFLRFIWKGKCSKLSHSACVQHPEFSQKF